MGLFKLTKTPQTSGIPTAIEFSADCQFADSDTRMTGDDDEYDDMTGRGINSRLNAAHTSSPMQQQQQQRVDPMSIGFRGQESMVGKGVNSRRVGELTSQQQQKRNNPFLDNSNSTGERLNPFDDDDDDHANIRASGNNNGLDGSNNDNRGLDDIMQEYEHKMKGLDQNKFSTFGSSDDEGEESVLSDIEEENSSKRGKGLSSSKSIKSFFGIKSTTADKTDSNPPQSFDYHTDFDDSEVGSYISGEYDAEFDNDQGIRMDDAPIGVPNQQGGHYTHRQLEDELYLYKLETLNLTDACRELAEQLDEAERKLESVQAQATFRIHALEAELQDGHVGMKSLVKMTSTEMDSRLEALRALGKTASFQAEKIKERDMELNRVDGKLRKTLRDIKVYKRENKKIKDEKTYLKQRLGELEDVRDKLEESLAKLTSEGSRAERRLSQGELEKMDAMKTKLNDTMEKVGYLKSQVEYKDKELEDLREKSGQMEAEIVQVRDDLALKENDVVRVELQLERVRKDLFDAAAAAKTAEEARVEAQARETDVREELDEALAALEEVTTRIATLESEKDELAKLANEKSCSREDDLAIEEHKARIDELEKEVAALTEEKDEAIRDIETARASYEVSIAEQQGEIETLTKDVEVHAEQMVLAQSMLEEKDAQLLDVRSQLDDVKSEYNITRAHLEEDLAAKTREVSNIKVELDERISDVSRLEDMLTKLRFEAEQQSSAGSSEDGDEVKALAVVPSASANVAEMELKIERMERELASNKRQIDAAMVELGEKDKAAERIRADLEKLRLDKNARVEELESVIEEKNKTVTKLRRELDESKQSNDHMEDRLKSVQSELTSAKEAATKAEADHQNLASAIEESRAAEQAANHTCEKLKNQVELLQKAKEDLHSELVALRIERNNDQQSSNQAAAALAATNAARQAEMEMQIEKMQKDIDTKKREIDTIKAQLQERDSSSAQLKEEINNLRNEMVHYKEKVDSEEEQKAQALQAIADKEYFEEDEQSLASMNSELANSSRLGLFSRFGRSKNSVNASENSLEVNEKDKDSRIEQLEKTVTENVLIISNLKKELVSASSKFTKDESQRRMLIQRLENENQAYSIKLEVLENEFNELKKRRESGNFDGNKSSNFDSGIEQMKNKSFQNKSFGQSFFTAASENSYDEAGSTSSMSGVSAISGASKMHPLERDNKKLRKQKVLFESRISSLQTQLSEIQQIIPELMSKSKAQIAKLDATIKTQKEEAEAKEQLLQDEITELKQQNEQLQAATRSRLQASDMERQDEIEQLKMLLEAREATIAKLEALTSTGKSQSFKKKGGKLLRKKKTATNGAECEHSVLSGVGSAVGSGVGSSMTGSFKSLTK